MKAPQLEFPLPARAANEIIEERLSVAVAEFNEAAEPLDRAGLMQEIRRLRSLLGSSRGGLHTARSALRAHGHRSHSNGVPQPVRPVPRDDPIPGASAAESSATKAYLADGYGEPGT